MRPIVLTASDASVAAKYSDPAPLDHYIAPFSVSLSAVKTGTVNYTVQYTYDDVWAKGYVASSGNWNDQTNQAGVTANTITTLSAPVTAVRLKLATGSGSVSLTVLQAGRP